MLLIATFSPSYFTEMGMAVTPRKKGWLMESLSSHRLLFLHLIIATTFIFLYVGSESRLTKMDMTVGLVALSDEGTDSRIQSKGVKSARELRPFNGNTDEAPAHGEPMLYAMTTLVLSKDYFDTAMSMCASIHAGKMRRERLGLS